jgi:ubiquinone/menaquinone biosynthesis C-methylase UbiE
MPKALPHWTPDFYSRWARYYDLFARLFISLGEKGKRKVTRNLCSGKILDVACGTGSLLEMAAHRAEVSLFGSDISWGMLNETRRKLPEAALVQASFFALPFKDGAFANVVETNAVSAVEFGVEVVITEMLRVCQQAGQVQIGDYARPPRQTLWRRFMAWVGEFFGDYPHDYASIFRELGYQPEIEHLGFDQMYQCVRVQKGIK